VEKYGSAGSLVLAIILCEIVTELIVGSALLARWRNRMLGPDEKAPRLSGILVSCGYCLSVWVALGLTYALRIKGMIPVLGAFEPVAIALVVHRASNVLHVTISFTFKMLEALVSRVSR
jgi:predicted membrane chloride channel (bestrophin family)